MTETIKRWPAPYLFKRKLCLGRMRIGINMRRGPSHSALGRFGGGWNWKLGLAVGGTTVLLFLFVLTVTFSWTPRPDPEPAK